MAVITNRGFKNVLFFPKIKMGDDGFAVTKPPILLGEKDKINNRALALEDTVQEKNINADNVNEIERTVTQKTGTLTAYDVARKAFVEIFGYEEDDNGNIIDDPNGERVDGVLFFETEKSNGTKMQHWFYDCSLYAPPDAAESFDGTNTRDLELPITCRPQNVCGKLRFKATVYNGKTGFVDGLPTDIYKPTIETATATPTASPEAGAVEAGTEVELSTTTLGAVIYYTTDGSTPTINSTPYTSPIEITEAMTITAIAVKSGRANSEALTAEYTIAT